MGQDTLLPLKLGEEYTPAADIIESSVAEAGTLYGDMQLITVETRETLSGKPMPFRAW